MAPSMRCRRIGLCATFLALVGWIALPVVQIDDENQLRTPNRSLLVRASQGFVQTTKGTTTSQSVSFPLRYPYAETDLDDLNITYEQCMATLPSNRTKTLSTLLWLHIPKCGTSLGTVVHGYLCQAEESPHKMRIGKRIRECDYCELEYMNRQGTPFWDGKIRGLLPIPEIRKYCDWNVSYRGYFYGHNPLKFNQLMTNSGPGVVTLFRDPRKRAVSAWNHGKHTHHLGTNNAEKLYPKSRTLLENSTTTLEDFARHMHVKACQTKMLVGGQCGMYFNLTTELKVEAHRRLEHLQFVGLTDAYNMSVCLFHHMLGGTPQPHMFANARPASANKANWTPRKLPGGGMQVRPSAWKRLTSKDDPVDFDTFLHAKSIFISRLVAAGLVKK